MKVLLKVELHKAHPDQYPPFEKVMEEHKWVKELTATTWSVTFADDAIFSRIMETIECELKEAMAAAKVRSVNAEAAISHTAPIRIRL